MAVLVADVHYDDAHDLARGGAVVLAALDDDHPIATWSHQGPVPAAYRSGALYERELPVLRPLVRAVAAAHPLAMVVIDAHVDLAGGPGLGRRLFDALVTDGLTLVVVGIAKNPHAGAPALAVRRGGSERPLWVGAAGMSPSDAAAAVASMAGPHRLPWAAKLADHVARGHVPADVVVPV